MESSPVQTIGWLTHDGRDDPCDALPTEPRVFDLRPLVAAYRALYSPTSPNERIRVRLQEPGGDEVATFEVVVGSN